eukprot:Sdes_comp12181_c0_seq1m2942
MPEKRKEEEDLGGEAKKPCNFSEVINDFYLDETTQERLKLCLKGKLEELPELKETIQVRQNPFLICTLHNFVKQSVLEELKPILLQEKYTQKKNDLYEFYQTPDLKHSSQPIVSTFRDSFFPSCLSFMRSVTGIALNDVIDMNCSRYEAGGHLLCHDDRLDTRRIAFILYLVDPSWSCLDGGALDVFSMDDNNQPADIVASISPVWNSLSFFYVNHQSYHQVAEILSQKTRLSVGGWFHETLDSSTPTPSLPPLPRGTLPEWKSLLAPPSSYSAFTLEKYINENYLSSLSIEGIQTSFLENSSIQLREFLCPSVLSQWTNLFLGSQIDWKLLSPPNKRRYRRALNTGKTGEPLQTLFSLFSSCDFMNLLNRFCGLNLIKCYGEVFQMSPGDYTLLHDGESSASERLELILY